MTKPSDLSTRLRQERQQAVQERKAQEAAWKPPQRFHNRKRGPEPPPKPIEVPKGLPARLTGVDGPLRPVGMRSPAPVCCRRNSWRDGLTHALCPSGVPQTLHVAYAVWAEHHARCLTCGREDWFMPGDVRTVTDPLLAEGRVLVKGEVVYFRRSPDYTVLCPDGRGLFQQWCAQAAKHQTVTPQREVQ
mgnify:CR=1 FL=1